MDKQSQKERWEKVYRYPNPVEPTPVCMSMHVGYTGIITAVEVKCCSSVNNMLSPIVKIEVSDEMEKYPNQSRW